MQDKEFAARTALVTGGSRGLGRAIGLRLAAGGAAVAVNYAADDAAAAETKALIEAEGGACVLCKGDVSDPDAVDAMVATAEAGLGPIDLLVTSAGIVYRGKDGKREDMGYDNWRRVMAVNIDGTFLAVMALKDGMIERGFGRMVCISSVAALRPRPGNIAYSTSKAAVIGLMRSCSEAFAPAVRFNCIAPGLIETDMTSDLGAERREAMIGATPLGRIGRADEIAEMAAFLLSERSSYTTGQVLVASGGRVTVP